MKVHEYSSYEEYVANQTEENKRKIENVWVHQTTMAAVVRWYRRHIGEPSKILCHGTRNGAEQLFFKRHTNNSIEVLGTEISETATQFDNTIQWDFTKQKPEWVGYWDIVYSNSFDHSPFPTETICEWRDQLNEKGLLVIDHSVWNSATNNKPDPVDCLDISFNELENLITSNGMTIETRKPFKTNNDHANKVCDSWFYFIRKK